MSSAKEPKRLRFCSDDDLALLREFIAQNPLENPEKWENIQENVYHITGKKFNIRTLKDHLFLILDIWLKKDTENQKKSGVEEMYSERDHLLKEVSDICKMFEGKPSTTPKRKRTVSKEKQIANLGRLARENCALQFKMEQAAPKTSNSESDILISLEQNSNYLEQYYFLNSLPATSSIVNEIIIDHVAEESAMEYINKPNAHSVDEVNNTSIILQKTRGEIEKVDKKAEPRILGPIKSKQNKSSGIRRSALDYLKNKEDRDYRIKARELGLEERKLQLEERKIKLQENCHDLEIFERKERWELEKERMKQDLLERKQHSKIIEYQQDLIQKLTTRLQKYEQSSMTAVQRLVSSYQYYF